MSQDSNQSLDKLTILDFFAAMALIGLASNKTPLTYQANLAYGIGLEMLKTRKEYEERQNNNDQNEGSK